MSILDPKKGSDPLNARGLTPFSSPPQPSVRTEQPAQTRTASRFKVVALVVAVIFLMGIGVAAVPLVGLAPVKNWSLKEWLQQSPGDPKKGSDAFNAGGQTPFSAESRDRSAELAPGRPDTLRLPVEVVKKLGIRTANVERATQPRPLDLLGQLAFDTDRLARIHARFPGEVVEILNLEGVSESSAALVTVHRAVRFGDRVAKGQLLAVIWNTDLGNKKADLVDALTLLRVDQDNLERLKKLADQAGVSEAAVQQAEAKVKTDLNGVAKAERALRTWRVPEQEIHDVKQEAERLIKEPSKRDAQKEKAWPRVEVQAPFDGIVVERNIAVHDIVDTSTDLFKVANLDKLAVWAHVFEEDLPALHALSPLERCWKVRLQNDLGAQPLAGTIDVIGPIIDPNQHTAVVMGQVNNPDHRLHVGQFVIATVDLPAPADEVVIPTTALVEDGRESIVFVQPDPESQNYTQRRVYVARRSQDVVYVRAKLKQAQEKEGLQALQPGEQVVTAGSVELEAALQDLKAAAKQK